MPANEPGHRNSNWLLGDVTGGQFTLSIVSQSESLGSLGHYYGHAGWVDDFTGGGRAEVMYYSANDSNWWLGDVVAGQIEWSLVSQTEVFGNLIDDYHAIWIADFTGSGHAQVLFYYSGDGNWWLGNMASGQLQWSLVSQSGFFGNLIDGYHAIWIDDFTGVGHPQVMFYYRGDGNWWLGNMVAGQLYWSLVSQSGGFGNLLDNQHSIWTGDFLGRVTDVDRVRVWPG